MAKIGRPKIYKTEEEREQAKKDVQKRWVKNNYERVAYIRAKSYTKRFIAISEDKDLKEVEKWLKERKKHGPKAIKAPPTKEQ
jgi:hypothetical protein